MVYKSDEDAAGKVISPNKRTSREQMRKAEYRRPLIRKVIEMEEEGEGEDETNSSEEDQWKEKMERVIKTKNIRGTDGSGQKVGGGGIKANTQNSATSTTAKSVVESADKIVLKEISTLSPSSNPTLSSITTLSPLINEHPYNRETTE